MKISYLLMGIHLSERQTSGETTNNAHPNSYVSNFQIPVKEIKALLWSTFFSSPPPPPPLPFFSPFEAIKILHEGFWNIDIKDTLENTLGKNNIHTQGFCSKATTKSCIAPNS